MQRLLTTIGLLLAAIGLLNSTPSFGILPQIGPFPGEKLYPLVLGLALVIAVLSAHVDTAQGGTRRRVLTVALDALVVAVGFYAMWRYYVEMTALETSGLFFFEAHHAWIALAGCAVIVLMCWRIWGAPLAVVALVTLAYFYTGEHWPGIFRTAGVDFVQDTPNELWFNQGDGVLGLILGILISTIFPFILLGAMLEGTGGGGSMIRLSFHAMRRFRGGPAHAAILASGLFGTISGSAVANVVGTGVITIPMIKRRGFAPSFAGGIEATASTGGQIMPPIMGAAALVMADFIGINYLVIVVAAIVPALAYYVSLIVTVMFEARRLGVEQHEAEAVEPIELQDWINLLLVISPVAIVIFALIRGASPAGSAILALAVLVVMSFLNPAIRRAPWLILAALARGGVTFGRLLMAVGAVGIIVAVLGATGLPIEFAKSVAGIGGAFLLPTLLLAALAALGLGMGMPTLPAYLTIVIILGPALQTLGLSDLTGHFFVFYFGVASAITPPVAIAAYAAASIAGAGAMATAVAATRIGLVVFAIPFMFAYNPELLIVAEALVPTAGAAAGFDAAAFTWALVRTLFMIYMLASAANRFDARRLGAVEIALRLAAGLLVISPLAAVQLAALAVGAWLLVHHHLPHVAARRTA